MPKKVIPLTNAKISKAESQEKQLTLNDGDGLRFIVTTKIESTLDLIIRDQIVRSVTPLL